MQFQHFWVGKQVSHLLTLLGNKSGVRYPKPLLSIWLLVPLNSIENDRICDHSLLLGDAPLIVSGMLNWNRAWGFQTRILGPPGG